MLIEEIQALYQWNGKFFDETYSYLPRTFTTYMNTTSCDVMDFPFFMVCLDSGFSEGLSNILLHTALYTYHIRSAQLKWL